MFKFLKKRARAEHLKLIRQILEMSDELASFSERVARSGMDIEGGAANDAVIFRSTIDDLTPLLHEMEAEENVTLPPDVAEHLLTLWKDFRRRLDAIKAGEKAARQLAGR